MAVEAHRKGSIHQPFCRRLYRAGHHTQCRDQALARLEEPIAGQVGGIIERVQLCFQRGGLGKNPALLSFPSKVSSELMISLRSAENSVWVGAMLGSGTGDGKVDCKESVETMAGRRK